MLESAALIKCFKALSDRTRLRLLNISSQYELNVNEIVQVVGMIQSGVSRHLKILVESGLLSSRRDGSFTYYSAGKDERITPLAKYATQQFADDPDAQRDKNLAAEMISQRRENTRRFFKTIAPEWDQLKKQILGRFDLDTALKDKITSKGTIADLGCGTGELIQQMLNPEIKEIIGVDSSPEMLEQARKRLKGSSAKLRLGELEHLPVKTRRMDTVIMNMVLHYISQPGRPILEAYRVLKPGGIFLLSVLEKHKLENIRKMMGGEWFGFEKQEIKTWLKEAGFRLKTVDTCPVEHGLNINIFLAEK